MSHLQALCSQPGVKPGIFYGSIALAGLQAVSVAPWKEISLMSAIGTGGTLVATISLISVAVKTIFDILNIDESPCRTSLEWAIKVLTAVPFTTSLLNQSTFTSDLGIASLLRPGPHYANFQCANIAFAVLFMVSGVLEVIKLFQEKKSFSRL